MKRERGITLIALIVSIIIIIILSVITIRGALGDNGLIKMATGGVEKMKISEYKEELTAIGVGLAEQKVFKGLGGIEYLNKFKEKVDQSEIFKNKKSANIIEGEDGEEDKLRIVTKEGYIFDVTEKDIKYVGKIGDEGYEPMPDLAEESIKITLSSDTEEGEGGWTKGPVTATIEVNSKTGEDLSGFTIQYTTEDPTLNKWQDYSGTEKPKMTTNGTITARLRNKIGETSKTATAKVTNIDTIKPEKPTDLIVAEITPNSMKVTAKARDAAAIPGKPDEESGVAKIIFELQGEGEPQEKAVTAQKTEQVSAECTFTSLKESTEYTIIVKAVDKAGNESEVDNTKVVLAKANYSIRNNGKKTYYERLSEAYEEAVDKGGESGGGTIVLEKDVTEAFATSFEIAKTIQIDTNNKTLKIEPTEDYQYSEERHGLILIDSGTFTIKGPGNVVCDQNKWFITGYGGNINIEGVNIQTTSHAVTLQHGYSSNLTITDATINVSDARSTSFARIGTRNDYEFKNIC